jgi:choline dehydrogenase-like flavoprotein
VIIHGVDARTVSSTGPRTHEIAARTSDGGSLTVRARLVALAAGSIYTPALLMRSSVGNAHVGRHLHLHPVAVSVGIYDEDLGGVWSGVPQSVLGSGSAEIAGGHGFRIEIPQAYPGVLAASFPWWSGDAHRASLADARHAAPFIAIVRDRTEGRVRLDDVREPVIEYGCGPLEGRLLTRGMVECARIHEAAGASRQFTLHTPPVELRGGPLAPFVREIERRGVSPNRVALFSAHQMSSCRIGTAPNESAADPDGQLWGRPGVYVTDASAFPSASGVNPMLTVMALARRTASRMLSA